MVSIKSRAAGTAQLPLGVAKEKLSEIYTRMAQTRAFEEAAARLFTEGKVHGTAHFCIGEEATGIAVCAALEAQDRITATHRGHGQSIGANGIVGGGIPIAVGSALSQRLKKSPQVTVAFFGDGAPQHRLFSRIGEPRFRVEAARAVRLREQSLCNVHPSSQAGKSF